MSYSRTHVSDQDLLRNVVTRRGRERTVFAEELADIAEIDARELYLPAAHPSMFSWCVQMLGLSDDEAYKRIQAARVAREFPAIFEMLADGRLNLTAVCMLAPHLTPGNADELLAAATRRTNREIRVLLAQRFPQSEMLSMVADIPAGQLAAQQVERRPDPNGQLAAQQVRRDSSNPAESRPKVEPLSSESFGISFSVGRETHERLQYAQALASHQVRPGDVAEVFDRALKAWIRELEKTRFAATDRPRSGRGSTRSIGRHLPAEVRRMVWERDGGRCTFTSDAGHRCPATELLQFDHIDPVARGGLAVPENLRLRCRAHNQFEAERVFGAEFMEQKRTAAIEARARSRAGRVGTVPTEPETSSLPPSANRMDDSEVVDRGSATGLDIVACLRNLGFRPDVARQAAAHCAAMPEASLEERVRAALRMLAPKATRLDFRPAAASPAA